MSSSCGGVASTCEANVRRLESWRFAREAPCTRVDGRERISDAAPTTALAASSREDARRKCQFRPALQRCLTPRAEGIFASRHYEFRSVWSGGTVGGCDEL